MADLEAHVVQSWDDSIFAESAQAGFWSVLSLPPLLLGMLGSLAYIAPMFGPDTLPTIENQLINFANSFFSKNVVNEIIQPTVRDIVAGARGEVVSFGFVISLWAGSSAISAFVDSVVEAHDQTPLRHPVRQRFFALGLYVVMLVFVIASAPFVALGPRKISSYLPDSWDNVLHYGYYPALAVTLVLAVTILYRVSLPKPLPTHRLLWGRSWRPRCSWSRRWACGSISPGSPAPATHMAPWRPRSRSCCSRSSSASPS